ncbi:MAG: hypothetical protein AAGD11_02825 [Planctomycetota bacterium]
MNLLQSFGVLVVGLIINLGTVYCMHKSNQLRPIWSPYLAGIAVSITLTQVCIVIASRNQKLPLDIAIAAFIALIMPASALLLQRLDPTRTISGWEWVFYGVTIFGALGVGFAKHLQS